MEYRGVLAVEETVTSKMGPLFPFAKLGFSADLLSFRLPLPLEKFANFWGQNFCAANSRSARVAQIFKSLIYLGNLKKPRLKKRYKCRFNYLISIVW
jgi:hypothetical protein